jgi:hypothetical protein
MKFGLPKAASGCAVTYVIARGNDSSTPLAAAIRDSGDSHGFYLSRIYSSAGGGMRVRAMAGDYKSSQLPDTLPVCRRNRSGRDHAMVVNPASRQVRGARPAARTGIAPASF